MGEASRLLVVSPGLRPMEAFFLILFFILIGIDAPNLHIYFQCYYLISHPYSPNNCCSVMWALGVIICMLFLYKSVVLMQYCSSFQVGSQEIMFCHTTYTVQYHLCTVHTVLSSSLQTFFCVILLLHHSLLVSLFYYAAAQHGCYPSHQWSHQSLRCHHGSCSSLMEMYSFSYRLLFVN